MKIQVFPQVVRDIEREAKELKENIYGVFERLEQGEKIAMPLCKPLFSIAKRLYELRLSYRGGEYRVFYYIKENVLIYILHAMKKKSQKLDGKTISLLRSRIRSLI